MGALLNRLSGFSGTDATPERIGVRVDEDTGGLQTIEIPHHKVHEGTHFFITDYADLNTGEVLGVTFHVLNGSIEYHFIWEVYSNGPATIQLYEGATSVVGGTIVTPINSNRRSYIQSTALLRVDPAVGSPGTLLAQSKLGSSGGKQAATEGGVNTREIELILKGSTVYYVKFTALADSVAVNYSGLWYEVNNS